MALEQAPFTVDIDWLVREIQQLGYERTDTPGLHERRLVFENNKYILKIWDGTAWKHLQPDFDTTIISTITAGKAIEFDGGHSMITVHDGYGNFNVKSGVNENHIITGGDGGCHLEMSHTGAITLAISTASEGNNFTDDIDIKISSTGAEITGPRTTLNSAMNFGTPKNVTISAGAITLGAASRYIVDTEGGGAADDLTTINGGNDGDMIFLNSTSSNRVITVKDSIGNIFIRDDFSLTNPKDRITLMKDENIWLGISSHNNA